MRNINRRLHKMSNKSANDVIDRMQVALNVKSDNELCRELNIGRSTLGGWRSRDSTPYALCVNLSEMRNISLDWLLTGNGEIFKITSNDPKLFTVFDTSRMTLAIETVEEGLAAAHRVMKPDKKAQLIMAVYDLFKTQAKDDKQSMLSLVQSIAA